MAADPVFASTPKVTSALIGSSIETRLDAPTQSVTVFTAGTSGSLLLELDATVVALSASLAPVTLAGLIYIFFVNSGTYTLFDTITVSAVTASVTVAPWRATSKIYSPGIPLQNGVTVAAAMSVAPTTGQFKVTATGLDA